MIPHNRPTYGKDEERAVAACIKAQARGKAGDGRIVEMFEHRLADFYGVKQAICVGSGREAIYHMTARDDINVVPAYSCVAFKDAVLAADGFCEPSEDKPLDISVNTFGVRHPFGDIEDLTHGGTILRATRGVTSFGPTKLLAAGHGGAVLSRRDLNGITPLSKMSDLHAAVGLVQLNKLPTMIARRLEICRRYDDAFNRTFPTETGYRYILEVEDAGAFIQRIQGVECIRPVDPWVSLDAFPKTKAAYDRNVSIPCYPSLTDEQVETVIERVKACL